MGTKRSQLKIGVILSYIATGLNMIIHLIYTPVMIRLLGQSEYGLYTLVGSVVSYLSLFSLGFTGAYLRFYSRYKAKENQDGIARLNGMFLVIFLCMSAAALLCGLILSQFTVQLFGDKLSPAEQQKAKILIQILVGNIALTFPASVFDSMISAHEQFVFQRLITLAGILFSPLICLPLLLMGQGSVAVVMVTTLITASKLIVNIMFCVRKLHVPFAFHHFDRSLLKEISGFSFFLFLNMLIDQINWSVDKLILGRTSGTDAVAIYGVGTQINSIFISLSSIISSVFAPRVNRIVAENAADRDGKLSDLLVKVGRLQYMLVLYIFCGFIFCGRIFIRYWAGPEYSESYMVVFWLISPLILILPHSLGIEIRRAKGLHQPASLIMLGTALFNLLISIPLAIHYGASGAAFGTWIGHLVNTIWIDFYYVRLIHLDIKRVYQNMLQISKSVAAAVIFGLLGLFWKGALACIIWAILYSILYFILIYFFAMNTSEKKMIADVLNRVFRKFIKRSKEEA